MTFDRNLNRKCGAIYLVHICVCVILRKRKMITFVNIYIGGLCFCWCGWVLSNKRNFQTWFMMGINLYKRMWQLVSLLVTLWFMLIISYLWYYVNVCTISLQLKFSLMQWDVWNTPCLSFSISIALVILAWPSTIRGTMLIK